jgi:two-component system chemotaxis response regulator CheY
MAKVLSLGQCGADHYALSQFLEGSFQAEVIPAQTFPEALRLLRSDKFDLVLVNRLLDANGAAGVAFIGQLKQDPDLAATPVMLVSNHGDAQKQAVARGALLGFGKAELGDEEVLDRLRPLLGAGLAS